jgi:hypothetical protein
LDLDGYRHLGQRFLAASGGGISVDFSVRMDVRQASANVGRIYDIDGPVSDDAYDINPQQFIVDIGLILWTLYDASLWF